MTMKARTGPMPDAPKGYEYIPALADIQDMMRKRFDGLGITAVDENDPNLFLHEVGNFWDGPYSVRRYETQIELEYVYVYINPWTKEPSVFDEHGYFSSLSGEFNPW